MSEGETPFQNGDAVVHRIDEIRAAAAAYGKASAEADKLIRQLGHDIISAFNHYLHQNEIVVRGVPPIGDWNPNNSYRDAIFSSFEDGLLTLDPVDIGIAVRIDNLGDEGKVWVRLVVSMRCVGDRLLVSVDDEKTIELPKNYKSRLPEISEMLKARLLRVFTEDVEHFRLGFYGGDAKIGFHVQHTSVETNRPVKNKLR